MAGKPGVRTVCEDNGIRVVCAGGLDLSIEPELDRELAVAVDSGAPVSVDLTGADFIDSAVLRCLASHGRALSDRGDRLRVLVCDGGYIQHVLGLVRFEQVMDIQGREPAGIEV